VHSFALIWFEEVAVYKFDRFKSNCWWTGTIKDGNIAVGDECLIFCYKAILRKRHYLASCLGLLVQLKGYPVYPGPWMLAEADKYPG